MRIQFGQHSVDGGIEQGLVIHFFYIIPANLAEDVYESPQIVEGQLGGVQLRCI